MGTVNITQGSDRLGKVPKKDFFPVRKVPKQKTRTRQTMVRSSERGQIPIYCTSRFSIERAEGPGTVCICAAVLAPLRAPPSPAAPGSAAHSFTHMYPSAAFPFVQALCLGTQFRSFPPLRSHMHLHQLPLPVPGLLASEVLGLK